MLRKIHTDRDLCLSSLTVIQAATYIPQVWLGGCWMSWVSVSRIWQLCSNNSSVIKHVMNQSA